MAKEREPLGKVGRHLDGDNGIDRSELDDRFEKWYKGVSEEDESEEVKENVE